VGNELRRFLLPAKGKDFSEEGHVLKMLDDIYHKIFFLVKILSFICLVAVISLVFIQIVFRYALSMPLRWSDMLLSVLFTYLAMLGLVTAVYQNAVPEITYVVKKFSIRVQNRFVLFADVITLIICFILLIPTQRILKAAASSHIYMLPMDWSQVLVSFPIAISLLIIIYLRKIALYFYGDKIQIRDTKDEEGV